jgi:hypothetical protein
MDIMLPENVMNRRLLFAHAPARSALGGSTGIRAKRWLGVAVIITVLGMGGTVPAAEAPAVALPAIQSSTETVKSYTDSSVPLRATTKAKFEMSGGRQIQVPRTLTFSLDTPPKHGVVVLPDPVITKGAKATAAAVYTSARDYMGQDEFSWKVNDGEVDSKVATVKLVVEASVPVPESQMAHLLTGAAASFPAAFSGGGRLQGTDHLLYTRQG